MNILKNKLINGLIVALAFTFNIFVFAPLEIFYTNKADLWFQIGNIYYLIVGIAILTFIITFLPSICLKNKIRHMYIRILITATLLLYVQGNFLNFGYGILDGSEVNWNAMIIKGLINTLIWILFMFFPFSLKKLKNEEVFTKVTTIMASIILTIEIFTLTFLVVTTEPSNNNNFDQTNKFNLSNQENIVVLMSDTFEATYMNEILEKYPEYKVKLKDFTFFNNCTGVSGLTYSSMPVILTGKCAQIGKTVQQNINNCFSNTEVYKELNTAGYETELYLEKTLVPSVNNVYIDNLRTDQIIVPMKSEAQITKALYKYVAYRYLPHFLKSNFIVDVNEFEEIRKTSYQKNNGKVYTLDDVGFNNELITNGINSNLENKSFKFFQLFGAHHPYVVTTELKNNRSREYLRIDEEQRKNNQIIASLNLLCNYIDELKHAGVYENTNIIFLADHGYDNKFYPVLLVKPAEENKDFTISSVPISILEDFWPTVLNMATNSKDYGKDFFDYNEGEERIRTVYDYIYIEDFNTTKNHRVVSINELQNSGVASDTKNYYIVNEEQQEISGELKEKYNFNEIINLKEIANLKNAKITGINKEDISEDILRGCNISENIEITIKRNKTEKDVIGVLKIDEIYEDNEKLDINVNNKELYSSELIRTDKQQEIKFKIPKEVWNENKKLILQINLSNSENNFSKHENFTYSEVRFDSCWFEEI